MRPVWWIPLLFVSLACGVAHADTFDYDFHFDSDGLSSATDISFTTTGNGSFTYLSGSINGYVPATLGEYTDGAGVVFEDDSLLGSGPAGTIVGLYFIVDPPPDGPGVYTTDSAGREIASSDGSNFIYTDGSLTITDVPPSVTSATPEPGTWLLVGSGLLGVAAESRRRMRLVR